MQTYQSTPDYYRDYIEHGWLKDQAAKVHKYIERWRGKNGKWYYRYKSKAQEKIAKLEDDILNSGRKNALDWNNLGAVRGRGYSKSGNWSEKKSASGANYHKTKTTKIDRSVKAKYQSNNNLKNRGYSSSTGSGESKRVRNISTRNYIRDNGGINRTAHASNRMAKGGYAPTNSNTRMYRNLDKAWRYAGKTEDPDWYYDVISGRNKGYSNSRSKSNKGYSGLTNVLINDKSKAGQIKRLEQSTNRSAKKKKK